MLLGLSRYFFFKNFYFKTIANWNLRKSNDFEAYFIYSHSNFRISRRSLEIYDQFEVYLSKFFSKSLQNNNGSLFGLFYMKFETYQISNLTTNFLIG